MFYGMISGLNSIVTWTSIIDILRDDNWFGFYLCYIGSWLSFFPTWEYYKLNQEYFNNLLK